MKRALLLCALAVVITAIGSAQAPKRVQKVKETADLRVQNFQTKTLQHTQALKTGLKQARAAKAPKRAKAVTAAELEGKYSFYAPSVYGESYDMNSMVTITRIDDQTVQIAGMTNETGSDAPVNAYLSAEEPGILTIPAQVIGSHSRYGTITLSYAVINEAGDDLEPSDAEDITLEVQDDGSIEIISGYWVCSVLLGNFDGYVNGTFSPIETVEIDDLVGDYYFTATSVTNGADNEAMVTMEKVDETHVAIYGMTNFSANDLPMTAEFDAEEMTLSIPSTVFYTHSNYGDISLSLGAVSGSNLVPDRDNPVVISLLGDGKMSISTGYWGYFIESGQYADAFIGAYYGGTFVRPNASMKGYSYEEVTGESPDEPQYEWVTSIWPVQMEQEYDDDGLPTGIVHVFNFAGEGLTVDVTLRPNGTAYIAPQTIWDASDYGYGVFATGGYDEEGEPTANIQCDVEGNYITMGAWGIYTEEGYSLGYYAAGEIAYADAEAEFDFPEADIRIYNKEWSTFYDEEAAYALPEGLQAYTVTGLSLSEGVVYIEPQEFLPLATPLLLLNESAESAEFEFEAIDAESYEINGEPSDAYQGFAEDTELPASYEDEGITYNVYILIDGMFVRAAEDGVLPAGKCVLVVPDEDSTAASRGLKIVIGAPDETTALTPATLISANGKAFDLAGRRTTGNAKGVVIINGKKVVR